MPHAEFEEKEYEMAFTIELAGRRGAVFSSGQVLEKVLGYDAAAHPERGSVVWEVLNVPRPKGLRLVQPHWRPGVVPDLDDVPQHPVSLLLQYKRPDFIYGARAKQWHLWKEPYYRFTRTPHQHNVLRRLERRLGGEAIVRYAAPAFWRRADLEHRHLRRTVIEGSGFVSPARLGGHAVWTYQRPGALGRPNPWGRALPFESIENLAELFASILEPRRDLVLVQSDPLAAHLRTLGDAARQRNPGIRKKAAQWVKSAIYADIPVDRQTLERVADIAAITTLMAQVDGSWHIAGRLESLAPS